MKPTKAELVVLAVELLILGIGLFPAIQSHFVSVAMAAPLAAVGSNSAIRFPYLHWILVIAGLATLGIVAHEFPFTCAAEIMYVLTLFIFRRFGPFETRSS